MPRQIRFVDIASLLSAATIACTAFWLFNLREAHNTAVLYELIPWLAATVLVYAVNRLFLRESRSFVPLGLLNIALTAVQVLVFSRVLDIWDVSHYTLISLGALLTNIFCVFICISPMNVEKARRLLEVSIIYYIFYLYMQTVSEFSQVFAVPSLLVIMLSIFSLIWVRTEGEKTVDERYSKKKGMFTLFVILAVLSAVLIFCMFVLTEPIGDAVVALVNIILAGLVFLLKLLGKFLALFVPVQEEVFDPTQWVKLDKPVYTYLPTTLLALSVVIIILGGLIFLFWRLRHLRFKLRLGRLPRLNIAKNLVRLWDAIKILVSDMCRKAVLFWLSVSRRITPQGVYVYIERLGYLHRFARKRGETQSGYLDRFSRLASDKNDGGLYAEIQKLKIFLEEKYFGKNTSVAFSRDELLALRKMVNAFVVKNLFAERKNK